MLPPFYEIPNPYFPDSAANALNDMGFLPHRLLPEIIRELIVDPKNGWGCFAAVGTHPLHNVFKYYVVIKHVLVGTLHAVR